MARAAFVKSWVRSLLQTSQELTGEEILAEVKNLEARLRAMEQAEARLDAMAANGAAASRVH